MYRRCTTALITSSRLSLCVLRNYCDLVLCVSEVRAVDAQYRASAVMKITLDYLAQNKMWTTWSTQGPNRRMSSLILTPTQYWWHLSVSSFNCHQLSQTTEVNEASWLLNTICSEPCKEQQHIHNAHAYQRLIMSYKQFLEIVLCGVITTSS